MAACLVIELIRAGGLNQPTSSSGLNVTTWLAGEATLTSTGYTCAAGSHLLLTVAEVNAKQALPVTSSDVQQAFQWGLASVLALWAIGWTVGVITGVIRKA